MISLLPSLSYNLLQNGPKYPSAWKKFGLAPGRMRKEKGEGKMLMFYTAFIENTCVHSKGLTGMREEGCGLSDGECGTEKATTFWQLRMVGNRRQRGDRVSVADTDVPIFPLFWKADGEEC